MGIHKHKDLTGKKFNKLTVLRESNERIRNLISWDCICECGNKHKVTGSSLTTGNIKSCGCLSKERLVRCMIGKKFGGFTVIKELAPKMVGIRKIRLFVCRCSCGNEKEVSRNHLKRLSGDCISCRTYTKKKLIKSVRGSYKVLKNVKGALYLCECIKCNTKKEYTHAQLLSNPKNCNICRNKELLNLKTHSFKVINIIIRKCINYLEYKCINCKKVKITAVSGFNKLHECSCIQLKNLNKKYIGKNTID